MLTDNLRKTRKMLELEASLGSALEDFLQERYWNQDESLTVVGSLIGVSRATVMDFMERLDIPRRLRSLAVQMWWHRKENRQPRLPSHQPIPKITKGEQMKERWKDPVYRDKMLGVLRKVRGDAEVGQEALPFRCKTLVVKGRRGRRKVYTPEMLRRMLDWKGPACSVPFCDAILPPKPRNIWNACSYHSHLIAVALRAAEHKRKAVLAEFGLEPI